MNNCALTNPPIMSVLSLFITLIFSRASLDKVFFPSVTLCNINQGRRSFFLENGLNHDSEMLREEEEGLHRRRRSLCTFKCT